MVPLAPHPLSDYTHRPYPSPPPQRPNKLHFPSGGLLTASPTTLATNAPRLVLQGPTPPIAWPTQSTPRDATPRPSAHGLATHLASLRVDRVLVWLDRRWVAAWLGLLGVGCALAVRAWRQQGPAKPQELAPWVMAAIDEDGGQHHAEKVLETHSPGPAWPTPTFPVYDF